jgi:hypothetical protein
MPTRHDAIVPNAAEEPVEMTLLELVQSIVREGGPEDEIVAAVLELLDSEEVDEHDPVVRSTCDTSLQLPWPRP